MFTLKLCIRWIRNRHAKCSQRFYEASFLLSTPITMVTHFYDSSADSGEIQDIRLKPARAISDAHIPCLVWAEDALSFAHSVPTCLFALQLLVPDGHVHEASSVVETRLS